MNKKYFNFHNKIELTWSNPLWSIAPDFAIKYGYFQQATLTGNCKVNIEVNSCSPPVDVLNTIKRSAERFGYGDDIIQTEHIHGRMRWTTWIQGLNSDKVTVWYDFPLRQRFQWPWFMFPDYLIGMHLIEPVLEYKFSQLGVHVLHSAALADSDGNSCLLAGCGGVGKTTYMMQLLKHGWSYLADDCILSEGDTLFAYPLCSSFFDYHYLFEEDENITKSSMIGALKHVRRQQPISFPVTSSAKLKVVNLLIRSDASKSKIIYDGVVNDEVVERLLAVDKLERLNFTDIEELYGRFMIQLDQVCGYNVWDSYWHTHENNLNEFIGSPCRIIEVGNKRDLTLLKTTIN